jgi:hypothetical protein
MNRFSVNSSIKFSKPTNGALNIEIPKVGCQATKLSHIEIKEGMIKRNNRKHSTGIISQTENGILSTSLLSSDRSDFPLSNPIVNTSTEFIALTTLY